MTLKFTARSIDNPASHKSQCAVVAVGTGKSLKGAAKDYDKAEGGVIKQQLKLEDFSGKRAETSRLAAAGAASRLLLIGIGDGKDFNRKAQLEFCQALARSLAATQATEATLFCDGLPLKNKEREGFYQLLARTLVTAGYRYSETLSKPKPAPKLARLVVAPAGDDSAAATKRALAAGAAIGEGINEARELANLPGNICTPTYLAQRVRKLARGDKKLSCKVLEEKQMREMGMGSLLSVSAGSAQPAKLIQLEYKGGKAKDAPYVLVGKGITFDSGGISLKPGAKMDEMKFDMGGAASVIGTMRAVASLGLPINVTMLVAASENLPSSTATKPGDVVTSMSGQTIEILNTDAEGRLVLCDALTYAERFKPAAIIDVATLTGACVVALGSHASGLYANQDELAEQLLAAGDEALDRAWRMPLWDDYQKQINSNFADMANIGGPGGGSITAACFLARFTEKMNWAHLDIAGTAWDSAPKGATGRPVAMLTQYLQDRAAS